MFRVQDVNSQESHSQSSCVYYLTRERVGPPDGATPSYKVKRIPVLYYCTLVLYCVLN